MCDYCADGIWYNGSMLSLDNLPRELIHLSKRLRKWQNTYESFNFYNTTHTKALILKKKKTYRDWLQEGRDITKEVRSKIRRYVKVEYFNESTSRREQFRKKHECRRNN